MLLENSSFNRKYSERISRRSIDMNTISFFINKKKAAIPAAVPSKLDYGTQYWVGIHRKLVATVTWYC
jgi:hypothetical protein